ncbi:sensor histidine kinase [Tissierella carlieri]|uniref:sensor histidine kinase n=1 Tax=Tissierella carlieri TaxID=689904 RepID=UPI001C116F24|nr:sensor histidine kinase [uncultured Tissierella sp.]MBU5311270.1 sensor histidine kinase [Tissierella carlieri]MDU5083017.1 sensor histidine kinase [Bacillota bacterium]
MLVILLKNLSSRVGIILILALFLSKIGLFRKLVSKENIDIKDKILLSIIFGIFGIIGTYTGIHLQGAIVNSRVIGVFVGGLLGGPLVGILSGIIAGGHRFLIDIGGFTAIACGISTLSEGAMAGLLKKKFESSPYRITFALISGAIAEVIQMIIILLVARPFSEALDLVKIIGIPMIVGNGIGIAAFIAITDSIFKEIENEAVYQAQLTLKIADRTLAYFRKGYNEDTARDTANIIYDMSKIKAVAFTDTEKILAHVGIGEDHHLVGSTIQTNLTKEALLAKKYVVANTREEIGCNNSNCPLKSAIIVPIKEDDKVIGTLKLYKGQENSITKVDIELALGLAQMFSTQIELSKIDYQRELLSRSELKALQAQINPHFLFNAINTIVSLTRTQPDNARKLLIHLGNYFRTNLQQDIEVVDLYKEIEHINSYIEIEKARFGDKLDIIYDIPENIECKLPPLLLQPIVENAIKHGVLGKIEGGRVEIIARDNGKETKLVVKDDGVGISKEDLDCLFKENDNKESIGLKNVNERLRNKYGKEYGLILESEINKGTTATMVIPKF